MTEGRLKFSHKLHVNSVCHDSTTKGPSKVTISFSEKNIFQHQQFVKSLAELSEPIRIPSLVMTFAVIRSLGLMRLQNCSIIDYFLSFTETSNVMVPRE